MLDNAVLAILEKFGDRYEIVVDPDNALLYKQGQKKDFLNILAAEEIYSNAKKGEHHTSAALKKVFGTDDVFQIAQLILNEGELQLTTEQKRKMHEEKRKRVVALLMQECIDPRTGAPHTQMRIEQALEEAKVHVDNFKSAEEQITEIIKKLIYVIPIKMEKVTVAVKVPAAYAQKAYGTLRSQTVRKEEWAANGDLIMLIEISPGLQGAFYDRLNKLTGGEVQTKLIGK